MTEGRQVTTTLPDREAANRLGRRLVEERLAACVNVLPPMQSTYRWKDAIESEPERQVLIKTTESRLSALEARIRDLHPYEVPEFVVMRAERGSDAYIAWVEAAVSRRG